MGGRKIPAPGHYYWGWIGIGRTAVGKDIMAFVGQGNGSFLCAAALKVDDKGR